MPLMPRPVLKYTGSKYRIAEWVISHFPPHKVYIEPFSGGASVLMAKEPADCEVYNDKNAEIVNVFKCLRDNGAELERLLRLTPWARDEYLDAFETVKNGDASPVELARCTIVKAYMGIKASGATRTTKVGFASGNSKRFAQKDWRTYADALPHFVERLKNVVIENYPAETIIERFDAPDTLIYCDPPYVPATFNGAERCYGDNFYGDEDHQRLLDMLKRCKGYVLLSGYDSEMYQKNLPDWVQEKRETLNVNNEARTECLWYSPRVASALGQKTLFD